MSDDETIVAGLGSPPTLAGSVERERARESSRRALFGTGTALRIGRFTVLERLGQGGMGVVYGAYDPELDRKIALKLLPWHDGSPATRDATTRLVREAKAMARVSHPNVVAVYEVGTEGARVFVAMEFVEGTTLDQWLRDEDHDWRHIGEVYLQAARGLAAVHTEGLVHRDFKPSNVIVDRHGRARVLDFGIARLVGDATAQGDGGSEPSTMADDPWSATPTGGAVGTPGYMAPEQHLGGAADARSDQFGLCAALWESVYGTRPFDGATVSALIDNVLATNITPPPRHRGPAALMDLLRRGLQRDPAERFTDMDTLVAALERIVRPAPRRTLPMVLGLGLAAVFVALAIGSEPVASPCDGAGDPIETAWNDARRRTVREAFDATGRVYAAATFDRVAATLDEQAQAWASARRDACRATHERGERSAELLDRSTICLDQRRQELHATVDVLADADVAIVDRSIRVVSGLQPIEPCRDPASLLADVAPPASPALAVEVRELRGEIARVRSQRAAGHFARARTLAADAVARSAAVDYPPVRAEAQIAHGRTLVSNGEYDAAAATLEAGYWAAVESKHRRAAFEAAYGVAYLGTYDERAERALAWARQARTLVELAGLGDDARALVATARGGTLSAAGRYEEAVAEFERALALTPEAGPTRTRVQATLGTALMRTGHYAEARDYQARALASMRAHYGPAHPQVAAAGFNLGMTDYQQGNIETALASFRDAAAVYETSVGPDHPDLGLVYDGMGVALDELGRFDEAVAAYERSLEILRKAYGDRHAVVAARLDNLATTLVSLERYDEAEAAMLEALEIARCNLGAEHPQVARPLHGLGHLHAKLEHWDRAIDYQREAQAIWEAALGPEHPDVAFALAGICNALVHSGRQAQALEGCERALQIREQAEVAPLSVAESRRLVAEALWPDPTQRTRAAALLRQAREVYAAEPAGAVELDNVDALLAELGIEVAPDNGRAAASATKNEKSPSP